MVSLLRFVTWMVSAVKCTCEYNDEAQVDDVEDVFRQVRNMRLR
jgi:hypothetical protein